jgi:predicted nucleic acid-binding protein
LKTVIVDTSILFSILLWKGKRFRDVLFSESDVRFYCCRFAIVELFKHKEKLLKYSVLSEEELLEVLYSLLTRLSFFDEQMMTTESVQQAYELCWDVDEKDTPFVALTIELNGWLWTKDDVLKDGLRSKGFDRFFEPD